MKDSKSHIRSFSFNFWFVSRKSQNQQKVARKITHFAYNTQITNLKYKFARKFSLILQTSTRSTLFKIYSCNAAKNLTHFTNFPAKMFLVDVRKIACTALFLDIQELHFWSTWKANVCISLYISVRKLLFWRRRRLLSGEEPNNFLVTACCLDIVKCFKMFQF